MKHGSLFRNRASEFICLRSCLTLLFFHFFFPLQKFIDLWTMCTAVLIQGRVLDVLVGGAVGAGNPKLAGIYLQVAWAVIAVVAIAVFICWNLTEQIWLVRDALLAVCIV